MSCFIGYSDSLLAALNKKPSDFPQAKSSNFRGVVLVEARIMLTPSIQPSTNGCLLPRSGQSSRRKSFAT
jgi:hypothetical protein